VTSDRSDGDTRPPVFITAKAISIPGGKTEERVLAYDCEQVVAELAGIGTGLARLSIRAQRPPIIAPSGDEMDLIVGVEASDAELSERVPVIRHGDKSFRIWREAESFTHLGVDRHVYVVDRKEGVITFAPAARLMRDEGNFEEASRPLAEIPPAGREIRLWYRRGGGPEGNVAAHTLTVLKDPIAGVAVTNSEPATGGQAAETLENALVRGPQELHSLHRAVTARDFELVALNSSRAVARAQAITQAEAWRHAAPGTVEVLLVPHVPEQERTDGHVTAADLVRRETTTAREQIQQVLDDRRPMGTHCTVIWTRYKTVRVTARIVVRREENQEAITRRVMERLYQTITPIPTAHSKTGWPFGQALRSSHVFDIALKEPGVLWMDRVRLLLDDVPDADVKAIASDAFQPSTWYAGSGKVLFRSLNDGEGWEPAGQFDAPITRVRAHPERPGIVAVVATGSGGEADKEASFIHVSEDCGQSWDDEPKMLSFKVHDIDWMPGQEAPVLLLATEKGLYTVALGTGAGPVQVLVEPKNQDLGFYAVVAARDVRGHLNVAAAAQESEGIYLSSDGGKSKTFEKIGPDSDIRVLAIQRDGPRTFLWAGAAAFGGKAGDGCFKWELLGPEHPPGGWQALGDGWTGGSCFALAFSESKVFAASHSAGVLPLDTSVAKPKWTAPDVRCGLPLRRDTGRFVAIDSVASDPSGKLVLAGSEEGVYRALADAVARGGKDEEKYRRVSNKEFAEKVTQPPNWLFCSGEHHIEVVSEDDAERD
jgi:hypothetical protein